MPLGTFLAYQIDELVAANDRYERRARPWRSCIRTPPTTI